MKGNLYKRLPEYVQAMQWDGSKESYHAIRDWIAFNKFLLEGEDVFCTFWDAEHEEAPSEELQRIAAIENYSECIKQTNALEDRKDRALVLDWRYRELQFYAWGDDVEVEPGKWIIFHGKESDSSVAVGRIMSDADFKIRYEAA